MRHEGNKQGLYREKKIAQLGRERYDALLTFAAKHLYDIERDFRMVMFSKKSPSRRLRESGWLYIPILLEPLRHFSDDRD
jgi:hypothetical protein